MKKRVNTKENNRTSKRLQKGISAITVSGYKSISRKQRIEIKPLTILAGANSSGKSSIMQPLLLLKQTLEESFDPGALLLTGPNIKFTSVNQLLSFTGSKNEYSNSFGVEIEVDSCLNLIIHFERHHNQAGLKIHHMDFFDTKTNEKFSFHLDMEHKKILENIPKPLRELYNTISAKEKRDVEWSIIRRRCFLALNLVTKGKRREAILPIYPTPGEYFEPHIRKIIHLPGWRGNPEREYPMSFVAPTFHGTFEKYVASVVMQWQVEKSEKLKQLTKALKILGLTWKISAKPISDTQVGLNVGRLAYTAKGCSRDMVSIADVGFGVSQILPVLVGLVVAKPQQMVYIEQPEIHLHPRAIYAMAQILAETAKRGVTVVVETHSNMLLRGIQTQVAKGNLPRNIIKLHWFTRNADGSTEISCADLDKNGAFGDWPEDFDEVELEAESRYLNSAKN